MSQSVSRIINGLEAMNATGADATKAARLGFLEWAFCAKDGGTLRSAQAALKSSEARNANSDAARAFVGYLREATQALSQPLSRRGRRQAQLLH